MIHGHGNDLANYDFSIETDFSSNIWYGGMDAGMQDFLRSKISELANYPEADAGALKARLADHHKVNINNITAFNGSTEAFYTIAQAFSGMESVVITPAFSEYADACKTNKQRIRFLSNKSSWMSENYDNQLVWLANPNNPDGKTLLLHELKTLLKASASAIFIIDEAYIDLCYGVESAIPLMANFQNLIVVRSLTKAFAVPGARLGYIVANEKLVKRIEAYLRPWSVNTIAIYTGIYILENYSKLLPNIEELQAETSDLQQRLSEIEALEVYPSKANFFLVKTNHKTSAELKAYLLTNHKMLIRDASNFHDLTPHHFRIAIRGLQKDNQLVEAINQWINLL